MKTNLFESLNELNVSLSIGKSVAKKYDYASANIPKVQQKSFRIKIRKMTESFYSKEQTESTIKNFVDLQESILLVCTEGKKKFSSLNVAEVYPNFENLSANEKKTVADLHTAICKKLSPGVTTPEKKVEKAEKKVEKAEKK